MIDLRYHIVSIVSIFLALAVGILLGAGPLQEDLGKTLSNQVSTLREEKAELRTQLTVAQQRVDAGNEFATTVLPQLVGSQLSGRSVVFVTLPGTDTDTVGALTTVLTTAGARVNGMVTVTDSWTDPAKSADREKLAGDLLGTASAGGSAQPDIRLAALLADALVVPRSADADQTTPAATRTLASLKAGDLITFDGAGPVLSTLAVVIAPTPTPTPTTQPAPDQPTVDEAAADLAGWLALARSLDTGASGAAVVGEPASADAGGLVAAVRQDGAAKRVVSTVDDVAAPMGRVATVYALREQVTQKAGQYGVGPGASAVLPTLPAGTP